jgi:hypothetical protein
MKMVHLKVKIVVNLIVKRKIVNIVIILNMKEDNRKRREIKAKVNKIRKVYRRANKATIQ